tara:strand:- start:17102 stop:17206 length:105 start_codon:yes stop_codon:yes gene_type:complete
MDLSMKLRIEGRLIRVGAIAETPVGKKRFIVDGG